jgi:two-component system, NtrC family, nitrogen regulation response regulator NtrX
MRRESQRPVGSPRSQFDMVGSSPVMQRLYAEIAKVAPTRGRVLICGESGTGKELIARAIHDQSALASCPFVMVNCAAISSELIESELFGHERGSFTGAVGRKRGLFEVADGGTIFLDEVGEMSPGTQAKVLRVLQTGELTRVGGEEAMKVDVRVVSATNKDLEQEVAAGRFREDLYFRLNVVPLRSPALREHTEDIPDLVMHFVSECCAANGIPEKPIEPGVLEQLVTSRWPGNVRELRNTVERMVIMSDEVIRVSDLPSLPRAESRPTVDLMSFCAHSLHNFLDEMAKELILMRLAQHDWNISRTAASLGIERTNLHKRLRAYGIHRGRAGRQSRP